MLFDFADKGQMNCFMSIRFLYCDILHVVSHVGYGTTLSLTYGYIERIISQSTAVFIFILSKCLNNIDRTSIECNARKHMKIGK